MTGVANAVESLSELEAQVQQAVSEIVRLREEREGLIQERSESTVRQEELDGQRLALERTCRGLEKDKEKLEAANQELRLEVERLAKAARESEKNAEAAAAELDAVKSEDDAGAPAEDPPEGSDPRQELTELQDAWKSEKQELRTQVQGLLDGLETLLEESRQRPSA